jgi:hypothetical protein
MMDREGRQKRGKLNLTISTDNIHELDHSEHNTFIKVEDAFDRSKCHSIPPFLDKEEDEIS